MNKEKSFRFPGYPRDCTLPVTIISSQIKPAIYPEGIQLLQSQLWFYANIFILKETREALLKS